MNRLYLGDCLNVLREEVESDSVDLVYIDPPFNSKRDYSIFFDDDEIHTQQIAFEDTWSLKTVGDSLRELNTLQTETLYSLLQSYSDVASHSFPYLVMMGVRIFEFRWVLKDSGGFYLHCDPTMSHYLKTICDVVFGIDQFRNEVIWRRTGSHNSSRRYGPIHDVILFYSKSDNYKFKRNFRPYFKGHIDGYFKQQDDKGKYWTNALTGSGTRQKASGQPWKG